MPCGRRLVPTVFIHLPAHRVVNCVEHPERARGMYRLREQAATVLQQNQGLLCPPQNGQSILCCEDETFWLAFTMYGVPASTTPPKQWGFSTRNQVSSSQNGYSRSMSINHRVLDKEA